MFSKASDEWATPRELFAELEEEFSFDLDAAASPENRLHPCYFTKTDDALARGWFEWADEIGMVYPPTVFVNPPYSKCRQFIAKAAEEAANGCTVVCLVPSRTDTKWWHQYVWDSAKHRPRPGVEVRFLQGRLKFGNSQNSAPFPSVVIVFRPA